MTLMGAVELPLDLMVASIDTPGLGIYRRFSSEVNNTR